MQPFTVSREFNLTPEYWTRFGLPRNRERVRLASSELLVMEVLAGPLENGNQPLVRLFERLLASRDLHLFPISQPVLRDAAQLRATYGLKGPDAIHAASAFAINASLIVSNDRDMTRLSGIQVEYLDDVVSRP